MSSRVSVWTPSRFVFAWAALNLTSAFCSAPVRVPVFAVVERASPGCRPLAAVCGGLLERGYAQLLYQFGVPGGSPYTTGP